MLDVRVEGFSCSMDDLNGSLGISKLQLDTKKCSAVFFYSVFGRQNPGSGSGFTWNARSVSGSGFNESGSTTLVSDFWSICCCSRLREVYFDNNLLDALPCVLLSMKSLGNSNSQFFLFFYSPQFGSGLSHVRDFYFLCGWRFGIFFALFIVENINVGLVDPCWQMPIFLIVHENMFFCSNIEATVLDICSKLCLRNIFCSPYLDPTIHKRTAECEVPLPKYCFNSLKKWVWISCAEQVYRHGNHNYFKATFMFYHTDIYDRILGRQQNHSFIFFHSQFCQPSVCNLSGSKDSKKLR